MQAVLRADALRYELARLLGGRVEPSGTVETRRTRIAVSAPTTRSGQLLIVIRPRAPHRPPVAVEVPAEGLDASTVAAVVRVVSRTPWRSRLRLLRPRLAFPFRTDQESPDDH
ncbi:hypothetical protein [Streptomyces rimosus]|uniref:hypothetical protein n=1 Tax=Streptomyces rimosus TaxID=1927 RepID=UPI00131E34C3|nr:hypothetical protein [Streptomyces rimosus]